MSEKKEPHEQMTVKNNKLSATQEVLYQEEFKKADKVKKEEENTMMRNENKS